MKDLTTGRKIRIICGILFIIAFVLSLLLLLLHIKSEAHFYLDVLDFRNLGRYKPIAWHILVCPASTSITLIGYALAATGMFREKKKYIAVGIILFLACAVVAFIGYNVSGLRAINRGVASIWQLPLLPFLLGIAAYIFALLCFIIKGKETNKCIFGILSGLLQIIQILYVCAHYRYSPEAMSNFYWIGQIYSLSSKFYYSDVGHVCIIAILLIEIVPFFLLGFAFYVKERKPQPKAAPQIAVQGTKIERLTKLKDLLDKGIISQEEFDEKKKQII